MPEDGPELNAEGLKKLKRPELANILKNNDYGSSKTRKGCSTKKRREVVRAKAEELQQEFKDTNTAKATAEKHFLGIALSCSPADDVDVSIPALTCVEAAQVPNNEKISIIGVIDMVKHTKTKKGKKPGSPMCFLSLSDSTYSLEHIVVFPGTYDHVKDDCKPDTVVLISGQKRDGSLIVSDIKKLL
jgi:DNA polymerase III alpha subunit